MASIAVAEEGLSPFKASFRLVQAALEKLKTSSSKQGSKNIASIDNLIPVEKFQKQKKYRIFIAVLAGKTRLIDNEEIKFN